MNARTDERHGRKLRCIPRRCTIPLFVLMILFMAYNAEAFPPLPTEFYGTVKYYNIPGVAGSAIKVFDAENQLCGTFSMVNTGFYGTLSCRGDNPDTAAHEGASPGEALHFTYNDGDAGVLTGDSTFTEGSFKRVDLIIPPLRCGDSFCDNLESQQTCPADCGMPVNETPTHPPGEGGGGETTGGGGGAKGSGGGGGGTSQPAGATTRQGQCDEQWECSPWSACQPTSIQYRNCNETSSCGTTNSPPPLQQDCVYMPTCYDGLKNGLETGIDCGGPCPPCRHCFDGVQDFGEAEIDCGGPCPACPSCSDGIKNGLEKRVDCGGNCPPCKGFFEAPRIVCVRIIEPWNPYFIIFVIIIVIVIGIRIGLTYLEIKVLKKNQKMEAIQKAVKAIAMRRRMYLFIISILIIFLIVFLYYYFIGICYELNLMYIWLLLLLLLLVPTIIHYIMKHFEYHEKELINNLRMLYDTHYKEIMNLINIETEHLVDLEHDVGDTILALQNDPAFAGSLEGFPEMQAIYRQILVLFDTYQKNKIPYSEERLLCDSINALMGRTDFAALAEKEPKMKEVMDKLSVLYKAYAEKQELYDELEQIEAPEGEKKGGHPTKKDEKKENDGDAGARPAVMDPGKEEHP